MAFAPIQFYCYGSGQEMVVACNISISLDFLILRSGLFGYLLFDQGKLMPLNGCFDNEQFSIFIHISLTMLSHNTLYVAVVVANFSIQVSHEFFPVAHRNFPSFLMGISLLGHNTYDCHLSLLCEESGGYNSITHWIPCDKAFRLFTQEKSYSALVDFSFLTTVQRNFRGWCMIFSFFLTIPFLKYPDIFFSVCYNF